MILATKSSTPIIGQLATVMGWIMDGIYRLLNIFGIQNIGLCIVIFSILIYALMTPLQIKQQKFSKLSAIMQPELQKIQKKYKGKNNDTAAMQKMQEETQAVYQKYGVSPTGSCVQLAIQFPILMALYQVIYKIPAYVGSVRDILASAVTSITGVNGYTDILQQFITNNKMTRVQLIMDGSKATSNSVTDFLYALSPSQWKTLAETSQFAGFTDTLNSTAKEISHVQNFFGLNIADQPLTYIKAAFCRWICSSCYRCDSYPDSCVGYTDDQLKTDASGSTAERRFTAGCNDELHEDNEYGNAVDVSSILFHIPCRSWYLLGSKCCSKKCAAGCYQ